MADSKAEHENDSSRLEACVGLAVVVLATFLGICSVKAGNIAQQMERKQVERNNNWAWFQARNIRGTVYEASANELSLPRPQESAEAKTQREALSREFQKKADDQKNQREEQEAAA